VLPGLKSRWALVKKKKKRRSRDVNTEYFANLVLFLEEADRFGST
jgi:hypothetical protein